MPKCIKLIWCLGRGISQIETQALGQVFDSFSIIESKTIAKAVKNGDAKLVLAEMERINNKIGDVFGSVDFIFAVTNMGFLTALANAGYEPMISDLKGKRLRLIRLTTTQNLVYEFHSLLATKLPS